MGGMKAKVQLTGLDEYLEKLQRAGANIDKVVSEAIAESARPIHGDIQEWAYKHVRTGATLAAVKMSDVQRDGDKFFIDVGIDTTVEKNAWHAVFVEYGTPKMKADPGIRTAFKNNKAKVKKIQRDILSRGGVPND